MDKHGQLLADGMNPGPNLFNSKSVSINAMHLLSNAVIRPNLELKTRLKQL